MEEIEEAKKNDLAINGYKLSGSEMPLTKTSSLRYPDHTFKLSKNSDGYVILVIQDKLFANLLYEGILPLKNENKSLELSRGKKLLGFFKIQDIVYSHSDEVSIFLKDADSIQSEIHIKIDSQKI